MKHIWFPVLLGIIIVWVIAAEIINSSRLQKEKNEKLAALQTIEEHDSAWISPSMYLDVETSGEERKMVIYGEDLIAHTSKYFGPKGSISHSTIGMNCQNLSPRCG